MPNDEITIDKNNLDEECVELPADYDEWSSIEERALAMLNALITKRAVVKAKSSLYHRGLTLERINKKYRLNLEKVTEQAHKDLVYLHIDVIEVTQQRDEMAEMYHISKAKRQSIEKGTFLQCLAMKANCPFQKRRNLWIGLLEKPRKRAFTFQTQTRAKQR